MSSMDDVKEVMTVTGLEIAGVRAFPHTGEDFSGYKNAQKHLESEGYTVGQLCYPMPTAASKSYGYIAKWKNIQYEEWPGIQAMIVGKDYRDSSCLVVFFKEAA